MSEERMNKESTHFTVAQLIETLQSLPQNLPILTSGYESGYENVRIPKIIKLTHQPDSKYWDGEFQVAEKEDGGIFEAVVLERVVRDV